MTAKQIAGLHAPDGAQYVTLTDGAGTLAPASGATLSENLTQIGGNTVDSNSGVKSAGTLRVVIATDQPALTTAMPVSLATVPSHAVTNAGTFAVQASLSAGPTTGTQSIVASSATDVTILASNANRLGAMIFNDSTQILYLLVGSGTSSATVYTVQIPASGYYELPETKYGHYTGILKGLWASANGNARVTELT